MKVENEDRCQILSLLCCFFRSLFFNFCSCLLGFFHPFVHQCLLYHHHYFFHRLSWHCCAGKQKLKNTSYQKGTNFKVGKERFNMWKINQTNKQTNKQSSIGHKGNKTKSRKIIVSSSIVLDFNSPPVTLLSSVHCLHPF